MGNIFAKVASAIHEYNQLNKDIQIVKQNLKEAESVITAPALDGGNRAGACINNIYAASYDIKIVRTEFCPLYDDFSECNQTQCAFCKHNKTHAGLIRYYNELLQNKRKFWINKLSRTK